MVVRKDPTAGAIPALPSSLSPLHPLCSTTMRHGGSRSRLLKIASWTGSSAQRLRWAKKGKQAKSGKGAKKSKGAAPTLPGGCRGWARARRKRPRPSAKIFH